MPPEIPVPSQIMCNHVQSCASGVTIHKEIQEEYEAVNEDEDEDQGYCMDPTFPVPSSG
jgi:hypothetical protein